MSRAIPRTQALTERAFMALERFLHIEAMSGIVLLVATLIALIWANSSNADTYHALWHTEVALTVGSLHIGESLHFLINDGLMTIFFLVVGMEIRREIHEGALASLRLAALPIVAALGGVVVPAVVYVMFNPAPVQINGWAIPTATDIAFAVGVLALLGRSIPGNVRIFLLSLAIIDDIVAVLVIALFYSGGLEYSGFLIAGGGIGLVLILQRMGIGSAYAYVLPGAVVWFGLLKTGAHPTLAGVVLGLITPIHSKPLQENPLAIARKAVSDIETSAANAEDGIDEMSGPLKRLREAQRELLPPVVRIQMALHPWVAYGVMPVFALANAGIGFGGNDLSNPEVVNVMLGVFLALVIGKPLGVISASWLAVRLGLCRLPDGVSWTYVTLIGLLAGIGFTMSIFIAMLAFEQAYLIEAAKMGVLFASLAAALLGLAWGALRARQG
ncbi:MAG: Na+/H+ antiporter NhaA [Rhodocyclaceae bacterium]|nr:Na+/H+ antiporter NhaA [Rhodocyclaceae bacterium]